MPTHIILIPKNVKTQKFLLWNRSLKRLDNTTASCYLIKQSVKKIRLKAGGYLGNASTFVSCECQHLSRWRKLLRKTTLWAAESLFLRMFPKIWEHYVSVSCGALTVTVSVRVVESLDPARYKPKQHTHFSINILCLHIWDTTRRKKIKLQFGSIVSSDESGTGVQCAETQISLCNREHKHTLARTPKKACVQLSETSYSYVDKQKRKRGNSTLIPLMTRRDLGTIWQGGKRRPIVRG